MVRNREIAESIEFATRPQQKISEEARSIHGIRNEQAAKFESFDSQWQRIDDYLKDQLIVIHNASFDWPILLDHVDRHHLLLSKIQGVFCSQKAAISWAQAMSLQCSHRGPSLDTLTKALDVESLRIKGGGIHGAKIDSCQAAQVIEVMRCCGKRIKPTKL